MKLSRSFSILILLFILHTSIAVTCPTNVDIKSGAYTSSKTCPACVYFMCMMVRKEASSWDVKEVEYGFGCPEDFYDKCSAFSSDVDFIKKKSPSSMDYKRESGGSGAMYISGCGGETDGTQCLKDKVANFHKEVKAKKASDNYEESFFYWNDGKDSYIGTSSNNVDQVASMKSLQNLNSYSYTLNWDFKLIRTFIIFSLLGFLIGWSFESVRQGKSIDLFVKIIVPGFLVVCILVAWIY